MKIRKTIVGVKLLIMQLYPNLNNKYEKKQK